MSLMPYWHQSSNDIAKAQSELAVMAAQIAALRKFRQKR